MNNKVILENKENDKIIADLLRDEIQKSLNNKKNFAEQIIDELYKGYSLNTSHTLTEYGIDDYITLKKSEKDLQSCSRKMDEDIKNPRLISLVTKEDLRLVNDASKILRLRRADFIRLIVVREAERIIQSEKSGGTKLEF